MSGVVNQLGSVSGVVGTTSGAGGFESGTKQVFHQTASPTGWTKLTASGTGSDSIDNICLRCITGTITNGVGGTVAMTTALASQSVASAGNGATGASSATTAAHTIAANESAAHHHRIGVPCNVYGFATCWSHGTRCLLGDSNAEIHMSQVVGSNGSHTHGGGSHTHTGPSHTHPAINLAVKYVDVIVASKD